MTSYIKAALSLGTHLIIYGDELITHIFANKNNKECWNLTVTSSSAPLESFFISVIFSMQGWKNAKIVSESRAAASDSHVFWMADQISDSTMYQVCLSVRSAWPFWYLLSQGISPKKPGWEQPMWQVPWRRRFNALRVSKKKCILVCRVPVVAALGYFWGNQMGSGEFGGRLVIAVNRPTLKEEVAHMHIHPPESRARVTRLSR